MSMRPSVAIVALLSAAPANAHDWYTDLKSPQGESCCNGRDCAPVPICVGSNGHEGLQLDTLCFPIPWPKVLDVPSPDGDAHVCWENRPDHYGPVRPVIRCVILPGMA
jgi:hypothetical protein